MGDFPHKLFVRFEKPSPHGFVLKRHEFSPQVRPIFEKPLDFVPHWQEIRFDKVESIFYGDSKLNMLQYITVYYICYIIVNYICYKS